MGDENVLAGYIQLYGPVTIYVSWLQPEFEINLNGQIKMFYLMTVIKIDAGLTSFRFYENGIFSDPACSNKKTNHAVIAVGFGSFGPGQDYWIVRK